MGANGKCASECPQLYLKNGEVRLKMSRVSSIMNYRQKPGKKKIWQKILRIARKITYNGFKLNF